MLNFRVSSYSNALYEIAIEDKAVVDFYALSKNLIEVIDENQNFIPFLSDISVNLKDKQELIKEIINIDTFQNFLFVLLETKRTRYLKNILVKFCLKIDLSNGIINGVVYTTNRLELDLIEKLNDVMSKKTGKTVKINNIIDNEIIGGIKVEIEGKVWDYTLSSQIKELTEVLVKEVENG